MIERWFPCKEVSENSNTGWGSGNTEKNLFTWFAARPSAQAKAAVLCSLLPWPEDEAEQTRLQDLVRRAMTGRFSAWDEVRDEIARANASGAGILDPFSGRGMIPLEASRLGIQAFGVDYSPMAVVASRLLADYPFRDWSEEPQLPFGAEANVLIESEPRLLRDVRRAFEEVGRRHAEAMAEHYPTYDGTQPWAYLWAVTLPCQECGHRFPLVASYELRKPARRAATKTRRGGSDPGQSFFIEGDVPSGTYRIVVHDGEPRRTPTLANALAPDGRKISGKSAVCPFCGHSHATALQRRMMVDGLGEDALLLVADHDETDTKVFRNPTTADHTGARQAAAEAELEEPFGVGLPAVPDEEIPDNNRRFIQPVQYGARTYGDLMCGRQTLAYIRLCRIVNDLAGELRETGMSDDYVRALTGYAGACLTKKLRRSSRGARLQTTGGTRVGDLFVNDSAIAFAFDFCEAGTGTGPGTWASISANVLSTLKGLIPEKPGFPMAVTQGTAADLPFRSDSFAAVVTDPPYGALIYYSDASDFLYVWLKRALASSWPELHITVDPRGLQDKSDEMIVKDFGAGPDEHRTKERYDERIEAAFREASRVVRADGVVTIVFGHGEPEVWIGLLNSIRNSGLVMTGSWPANTESGSNSGGSKANIKTTLTMACRPAPADRRPGRKGTVEAAIKAEVKSRYADWERWGLAPTDMLMAAAGPAMEIVGQYSEVLDAKGDPVDIATFLPLARAAVQEAMALEIDHHPLETFDARTRFALWWVRLFGREIAPKSELRWQTLAASLELGDVRDLVPDTDKGCQFVTAGKFNPSITPESAVIDVALALAAVSDQGRQAMGQVLADSGRDPQDAYLWAAVKFLADRLPDSDPDSIAFNRVMRSKDGIASAAEAIEVAVITSEREQEKRDKQEKLF